MKFHSLFVATVILGSLYTPRSEAQEDNYISSPLYAKEFQGVAKLHSSRHNGHMYRARREYPEFYDTDALTCLANTKLESAQRHEFWKWIFPIRREQRSVDNRSIMRLWYDSRPQLEFYSRGQLISVRINTVYWTGYLHPFSWSQNYNFALQNGKPKQLTLVDLFKMASRSN